MTLRPDRTLLVGCLLAAAWLFHAPRQVEAAPPTAQQRAEVRAAEAAIRKAGNFFRAKRYRESGEAANEAIQKLAELPLDDSPELKALVAPLEKQIEKARELLSDHGVMLSSGEDGETAEVASFSRQVAPLLVSKCGGCHVQQTRGEFSMATYGDLMKGSPAGIVVMAKSADGSRLIEVLESGDMPRGGGGKLSGEEIALLKQWINAGAKFDGPSETVPLATLAASAMPDAPTEMLRVVMAGDEDEVQFSRDVGAVLLEHCVGCHGERNPPQNFSVANFNRLLRGGNSGVALDPDKPAESLLIRKLRGEAGARMPQGRDPLPDETIARIEKWIELGARFDGPVAAMPLEDVVNQNAARRMTHAELTQRRIERADFLWRLILPDVDARREESANVLVVGGVGSEILSNIARTAEEQVDTLQKLFKIPDNEALIKGRLMLFVFDKRYDYGEVGTMLEHRELPGQWRGHWSYNPLDAYGCLLLGERGEASKGLVAQQLAGAYVASLGDVPRWFAEGSARAIAARVDPRDPRVRQWDEQANRVLSSTVKPEGFLTAALPAEDSDVLAYSFVSRYLMAPTTRYVAVVRELQGGTEFGAAFEKYYKGTPEKVVPQWLARVGKGR